MTAALSDDEFERRLRQIGEERYHDKHPFHRKLHAGELRRGQLQAWVLNRYYYQSRIPLKDAALLSRVDDREFRREWIRRILDHDGLSDDSGGIERWLVLAEGVGLDREAVKALTGVLPAMNRRARRRMVRRTPAPTTFPPRRPVRASPSAARAGPGSFASCSARYSRRWRTTSPSASRAGSTSTRRNSRSLRDSSRSNHSISRADPAMPVLTWSSNSWPIARM